MSAQILPPAVLAKCVRVYLETDRRLAHRKKDRRKGPRPKVTGPTLDDVLARHGIRFADDPRRYQYAVEDVLAAVKAREAA